MIKRVYGTANGTEIIFTFAEGERWTAVVPWCEDGQYVTELTAEDEAGNTAYLCSVLLVISGHELQGYIVPRGYTGSTETNDYAGLITIGEFLGRITEGGFTIERTVCGGDVH